MPPGTARHPWEHQACVPVTQRGFPKMMYEEERGDNTQGKEKKSTLKKHLGRKSWDIVIETPELEGWIREIMFIISVMFACVEQTASVPSHRDPPAWNLNSGDESTFSFHILGLHEASALG